MREADAICLDARDNVATALHDIEQGTHCSIRRGVELLPVTALETIAFGHKLAIKAIKKGAAAVKYGEEFGRAVSNIDAGAHVHTHNVESQRGRGDLAPEVKS